MENYILGEVLGEGAFGTVYHARHKFLDKQVAIKVQKDQRLKILDEAQILARLTHPHIVRVDDVGPHYLVMEYCSGGDLRARGDLDPGECIRIAAQVLDALAYAHQQGIIHQDIKPSNILFDDVVKVGDFGLAKRVRDAVGEYAALFPDDTLTNPSVSARSSVQSSIAGSNGTRIAGTPAYMAPEQHEGEATAKSDLYAVGLVLYEILTGQKPLGRFDLPSEIDWRIPKRLDKIVAKALHPSPERRFYDAQEFKETLEGVALAIGLKKPHR